MRRNRRRHRTPSAGPPAATGPALPPPGQPGRFHRSCSRTPASNRSTPATTQARERGEQFAIVQFRQPYHGVDRSRRCRPAETRPGQIPVQSGQAPADLGGDDRIHACGRRARTADRRASGCRRRHRRRPATSPGSVPRRGGRRGRAGPAAAPPPPVRTLPVQRVVRHRRASGVMQDHQADGGGYRPRADGRAHSSAPDSATIDRLAIAWASWGTSRISTPDRWAARAMPMPPTKATRVLNCVRLSFTGDDFALARAT